LCFTHAWRKYTPFSLKTNGQKVTGDELLTRREFLGLAAGAATGTLLAACAQPSPVPAPAAQPAAPAATAAPAKAAEPTKAPAATAAPVAPAAASEKAEKQELIVFPQFMGNPFDAAELDPARRGTWGFHSLLWAPLVFGDTAANVVKEKSVAESWEISPDGKTYTFKLRKNAKYSDGSPITAQDFANFFGYLAMMATTQAAGYRDNFGSAKRLLFDVQGLLDSTKDVPYNEFGATKVPGVKAVDDATLQITLNAPAENFINSSFR
jgi:ABC-type transport system substrate-binding protein